MRKISLKNRFAPAPILPACEMVALLQAVAETPRLGVCRGFAFLSPFP